MRQAAICGFLIATAIAPSMVAQSAAPEFDAMEIRPAKPLPPTVEIHYTISRQGQLSQIRMQGNSVRAIPVFGTNGQVAMPSATMRQLIEAAYKQVLGREYLAGIPRWLDSDRFDLVAKAPPNTPVDTQRRMLQTALARVFHLKVHSEDKPMPVYVLVVGKTGPKLTSSAAPSDPAGCRLSAGSSAEALHYSCRNMSIAVLAERLPLMAPAYVDQPVVDLTDLSGAYDFQLSWSPMVPGSDSPPPTTIFTALEKDLGLKLEPRKHPMPILVIDSIDRTPANQ